ncbi:IPExxxVDY family protein [Chryseosolibacter indicus]|uniref:IPExxxVDY family protein n=1 Tax=Chryseosolibacter indicus TaxID=2782351 RepID=A0ABS5VVX4_9BACT|nr:IPExxxVDY family protein [Chryseosolibacter indicus]MBT1705486.1 IPExxxVDY family protein [Chryseosolibacter indicus]
MKKSKLLIEYEFNFLLLGVSSAAKGYKLAWDLNHALAITLVKQPDLLVGFKNNEEKSFSFYAYETPLNRLKLFKNKPNEQDIGKYFLIPEFPHFDFIILAAMEEQYTQEKLIDLIRTIPSIQLVNPIEVEGLKSKSNFIF